MGCSHCFQNLKEHRKNQPNCHEINFNCKFCDKPFDRACSLIAHLKSHTNLQCHFCAKFFERKNSASAKKRLDAHMKSCSKPKLPRKPRAYQAIHMCGGEGCEQTFTNKKLKASHEYRCGLMVYPCVACGLVFRSAQLLGQHTSRHGCTYTIPGN